jgi:hypothetical protein
MKRSRKATLAESGVVMALGCFQVVEILGGLPRLEIIMYHQSTYEQGAT